MLGMQRSFLAKYSRQPHQNFNPCTCNSFTGSIQTQECREFFHANSSIDHHYIFRNVRKVKLFLQCNAYICTQHKHLLHLKLWILEMSRIFSCTIVRWLPLSLWAHKPRPLACFLPQGSQLSQRSLGSTYPKQSVASANPILPIPSHLPTFVWEICIPASTNSHI